MTTKACANLLGGGKKEILVTSKKQIVVSRRLWGGLLELIDTPSFSRSWYPEGGLVVGGKGSVTEIRPGAVDLNGKAEVTIDRGKARPLRRKNKNAIISITVRRT